MCGRQLFSALDPRGKEAMPTLKMITDDSFSSSLVRAPPGLLSKHGFMDHLIGEEMDWGHPYNRESVRNVAFQASSRPGESECVFISTRLTSGVKFEKRCYWAFSPADISRNSGCVGRFHTGQV